MIPTWTFRQLLGLPTEDWTEEKLNHVSGNELTDLCCLVGIPYSGTKPEKISRLLTQTRIQRRLSGYGLKQGDQPTVEQIQAFANTYKGKELKEMSLTKLCGGKRVQREKVGLSGIKSSRQNGVAKS